MSSLVDLLRASAAQFGPLPAIHFQGRTTTHAAFGQATDRFAAGLAARGIAPGDRVGLYCVNSDAFAIAYFGILIAGATVVPVNLLLNPKEVAYILKDAGVKALVYFEAFAEAVKGSSPRSQVSRSKFASGPRTRCRTSRFPICWRPPGRSPSRRSTRPRIWPPFSTPPARPGTQRARC